MKDYVIADLHGRYDLLKKAHDTVIEHGKGTEYRFITLGDYIDRGPESRRIIEYLMSVSQYPDVVCLKGNHEDMAVQSVTKPLMPGWWVGNGGDVTFKSYGWGGAPYSIHTYDCMPKSHIDWMANLPLYLETEKQVFVHAGVPVDDLDLCDQDTKQMMWMLYSKQDSGGYRGKHVVHGHHQFADGPIVWEGRTDLDTFAWKTGRIVIGVFDDSQGKALDFIEVNA